MYKYVTVMSDSCTFTLSKGASDLESTNLCHTSEGRYPVTFIEKSKGTRLPTYKAVVIPITVIKCSTQSYVCAESTNEISENIAITDIQSCRYYIATLR